MSTVIGLDLGSYAFKAVVGSWKGKTFHIEQAVEQANPLGTAFPTHPQQRTELAKALQSFFEQNKLPARDIRSSLPETVVVTKIISMPQLSEAELASAIHWQVEQHIPIPLEELQYEYSILRQRNDPQNKTMDILIVGVQKQAVQALADLFVQSGLDVADLETDTLAQLRVAEPLIASPQPVAFLHLGAQNSAVTIVYENTLSFVYSFGVAGFLLTRAVEQAIHLDPARAEEYKRGFGLLPGKAEGKVRQALQPVVQSIVSETQKAFHYFTSQYTGQSITRLYVSGGSLYLPDLLPFLSQSLAVEVVPLRLSEMNQLSWKAVPPQESRFITAVGLALKKET